MSDQKSMNQINCSADSPVLSPLGFCLLDLTEQFSLPDTSPPFLAKLLEAIERKGKFDPENPQVRFLLTQLTSIAALFLSLYDRTLLNVMIWVSLIISRSG